MSQVELQIVHKLMFCSFDYLDDTLLQKHEILTPHLQIQVISFMKIL